MRKHLHYRSLCLCALLAVQAGGGARAAEPADLAALLRQAEAGHPALQAAAARLDAARHGAAAIGAPPDPELSLAYVNDGYRSLTLGESDMTTLGLTWTQELPYPGKRRGGEEVAALGIDIQGSDYERARLAVRAGILDGWAEIHRLDSAALLYAEWRALLADLAEVATRRYEVGQGTQEGVLRAQSEILRLDAEAIRVASGRAAAVLRLNGVAGRAADAPVGPVTTLPPAVIPADPAPIVAEALETSPELRLLDAAARQDEAEARLARLERKPDFVWSATYMNRGDLEPMLGAMFGVRLPVYGDRRQGPEAARRDAEAVAARFELETARRRVAAEARAVIERAVAADRLAAIIETGLIPQARATLESARASYAVGRTSLAEVLEDSGALLAARIDLAERRAERLQALAALEPLIGRTLITVEPPGGEPPSTLSGGAAR